MTDLPDPRDPAERPDSAQYAPALRRSALALGKLSRRAARSAMDAVAERDGAAAAAFGDAARAIERASGAANRLADAAAESPESLLRAIPDVVAELGDAIDAMDEATAPASADDADSGRGTDD